MARPIINTAFALESMRHTQYKNTAYAVAELIDNAIQAGASRVEVICRESQSLVTHRERHRVSEIAVIDNGCGMDKNTLAQALEIGNGTRRDSSQRTGIGRFGMGLPLSSITQCTRVDVWTWRGGVENALRAHLDLFEIEEKGITEISEPIRADLPDYLRTLCRQTVGESGTLVLWTRLDRTQWRKADTVLEKTEPLIGRIYRRPLATGTLKIRLVRSRESVGYGTSDERYVRPNDPLYLTAGTSCPMPFADKPMFQPHRAEQVEVPVMDRDGNLVAKHKVTIRSAYALDEARVSNAGNPFTGVAGNTGYGKHAADNVGVSLIRADRELDLDEGLVSQSNPLERWWGVEVDFLPALDDIFGVTNNKQAATNFSALTRGSRMDDIREDRDLARYRAEHEGEPSAALAEVVYTVYKHIREMRTKVESQREGSGTPRGSRPDGGGEVGSGDPIQVIPQPTPQERATKITFARSKEGEIGASDADEKKPYEERTRELQKGLESLGKSTMMAREVAEKVIRKGEKYVITRAPSDSSAFFTLGTYGGVLCVALNTNHPAHEKLFRVLDTDDATTEASWQLRERIADASDAVTLLLEAWARYEDELPKGGPSQAAARRVREGWGHIAAEFLADH